MGIRYVYWLYLFDSLWRQPWMFVARECRNPHGLIIVNDTKKFGFNYFVQISWMAMRRVRAIEPNAAAATAFVCAYVCVCVPHYRHENTTVFRMLYAKEFSCINNFIFCLARSCVCVFQQFFLFKTMEFSSESGLPFHYILFISYHDIQAMQTIWNLPAYVNRIEYIVPLPSLILCVCVRVGKSCVSIGCCMSETRYVS